jgi:hypothetical protein
LIGTRLLAFNENVAETAVSEQQPIIIEAAPANAIPLPLPPTRSGGQTIVLDMAPIPQAITPNINPVQAQPIQQMQPVARTQTS